MMGADSAGAVRNERGGGFQGDDTRSAGGILPAPLAATGVLAVRLWHTTATEPDPRLWGRATTLPAEASSEAPLYTGL